MNVYFENRLSDKIMLQKHMRYYYEAIATGTDQFEVKTEKL
jgi:hypothetical protein